jgi:hypothetical protein
MTKAWLLRLCAGAAIALSLGGCYYPYGYYGHPHGDYDHPYGWHGGPPPPPRYYWH